jgi:Xaa-Pro aminopeptidase
MNIQRLKKVQSSLKDSILIKKKENLLYLTGIVFDAHSQEYLLVKKNEVVGFASGLEKMDWAKKVDRLKNIGKYLKPGSKLDIEYGFTYGEGKYLKLKLPKVKIAPAPSLVDRQRMIKDASEISNVRKSMQIVEKVFALVRREIKKPGMTERKLANFIQSSGLKMGAEDVSFPAIVASGANAAIPHHVPSSKVLKAGESIILDFGFKYKHYCSDFTRTVFLKTVPKKLELAYNQVEKAYNESIGFVNNVGQARGLLTARNAGRGPALQAGDVYQKAVDVLAGKHLEKYFIHSLGHGTGLEIHELPNLSPKSKDIMQNGMVFSIEPGVYFPKLGGIRIEDLVYLEKGECKKFINVPTKLKDNIL